MQDQTISKPVGSITVRGESRLSVVPDTAEIFIVISAVGATPKEAVEKVEDNNEGIRKSIRKANMPMKALRLTSLQVLPNIKRGQKPDGTYQEVEQGYIATQNAQMNLPLRGSGYLKVMENMAKNCPDARLSLRFIVKKTTTVERNLLRLAAKNAASDAKALAKTLGIKITGVSSVEKGNDSHFAPFPAARTLSASIANDPIKPADIDFSLSVLISFATTTNKREKA